MEFVDRSRRRKELQQLEKQKNRKNDVIRNYYYCKIDENVYVKKK